MITMCAKSVIMLASMMMVFISNPVKLSMFLLIISVTMFFLMTLQSGTIWFPTLFVLIFMGGILMMFMILSSILPNEKSMKMKIFLGALTLALLLSTQSQKFQETNNLSGTIKVALNSSMTMTFLILILVLYFFSVISILCKESMPMRMVTCCMGKLIL